ncbi:hypothetical protein ACFYL6_04595 [Micromonospora sp. NPDC007208]|uniref:hypothetical protein n=1 Tax=Micromonospora sp. NPDC007208 TaxID=3364236 RepID=UPI003693FF48
MSRRVLLDRDLALPWLNAALAVAADRTDPVRMRRALKTALTDAPLADEARKKTVTALARTWIIPSKEAGGVVEWATVHRDEIDDVRPLHLGALLATQPFFADLLAETGRLFAAGAPEVGTPELRRRMRAIWGSRRSVDVGVQRGVKTMRAIGVLTGRPSSSTSARSMLEITPDVAAWLARALLVAREADSVGVDDLRTSPEFFAIRWPRVIPRTAEGLEQHVEGVGRRVLVRTRS